MGKEAVRCMEVQTSRKADTDKVWEVGEEGERERESG